VGVGVALNIVTVTKYDFKILSTFVHKYEDLKVNWSVVCRICHLEKHPPFPAYKFPPSASRHVRFSNTNVVIIPDIITLSFVLEVLMSLPDYGPLCIVQSECDIVQK